MNDVKMKLMSKIIPIGVVLFLKSFRASFLIVSFSILETFNVELKNLY